MLLDGIYSLDFGNPVIDPNRVKQFDKRDGRIANVDLIVAYPDVVVGVAVDDKYFDIRCRRTDFVALASSTKGGPEPSESRTKDNNARHMIFPNARLELISREDRNQACWASRVEPALLSQLWPSRSGRHATAPRSDDISDFPKLT
jgi:hypothetical protein